MKKWLPILLVLVLAIASVAGLAETEEEITPYTSSIFIATDRHDYEDVNNLTAVLSVVAADSKITQPKYAILGGDSAGSGPDSKESGHPAYTVSEADEEFQEIYGEDFKAYYTFGSHDTGNTNGYGEYLTGPVELDGYYLYGITYQQMLYDTADQIPEDYPFIDLVDPNGLGAQEASANFLSWVDSLDDHKPILFMSHVPMQANRDDNLGAATWVNALNQAAESHDVFAFFGHNHSEEKNGNIADRPYYLVLAGSTMPVQGSEVDDKQEMELKFNYMNAGYLIVGFGSVGQFADNDLDGQYDEFSVIRYSTIDRDVCFGDTRMVSPHVFTLTQWD